VATESFLKYDSSGYTLRFPGHRRLLSHREPKKRMDAHAFYELLYPRLEERIRPGSSVGIVVSDKTRRCQYELYLPVLTAILTDLGLSPRQIRFYIAYGTHARQTEEESLLTYGETYKHFRFEHHNSRLILKGRVLGITARGTLVRLREDVLEHDVLITFGAILHHYFAGYGGGRKLLFPGLAAYDSILQNHAIFLDFERYRTREGCRSGELDQNHLARDLEEIEALLPPRLEIHALLNSRNEVAEIQLGERYADFRLACQRYDECYASGEKERFDLVVASAGGYPRDINFIQAHKAIHNAASFVKDEGKLIIFAGCRDGFGNPALKEIFQRGAGQKAFGELKDNYENNAGTVIAMLEKSLRIQVHLFTSLSRTDCMDLGAYRVHELKEVQEMIDMHKGSLAVLGNADMLYRKKG